MLQLNIVKPYENISEIFKNHLSISHLHTTITYTNLTPKTIEHLNERCCTLVHTRQRIQTQGRWKRKATKLKMNLLKSQRLLNERTPLCFLSYTEKKHIKRSAFSVQPYDNVCLHLLNYFYMNVWSFDKNNGLFCFRLVSCRRVCNDNNWIDWKCDHIGL